MYFQTVFLMFHKVAQFLISLDFPIFQDIVDHIRGCSYSSAYASSMSPPVVMQIISSMKTIMGEDGTNRGGWEIFPK